MNKEKDLNICILKIKVTTKAKLTKIKKISFPNIEISLHAIAQKGEANDELIKFLSKIFSISKSSIELYRGSTSSIKIIKIHSKFNEEEIHKILLSLFLKETSAKN